MCEITSDNFDIKFQEINYNLQKANYVGKYLKKLFELFISFSQHFTHFSHFVQLLTQSSPGFM